MQKPFKIILGIDPGTLMMGYGIIEVCNNQIRLKEMNVLKLPGKKDNHERLQLIHQKILCLIEEHQPNEFAIEAPFFGKNVQSMLKLGRAQGVAIAAAMSANLSVTEYSPKKVKQSITGNGNADKEQVWKMLQRILLSMGTTGLMKNRNIMMPQMPWQSRSVITSRATTLLNQMVKKEKGKQKN